MTTGSLHFVLREPLHVLTVPSLPSTVLDRMFQPTISPPPPPQSTSILVRWNTLPSVLYEPPTVKNDLRPILYSFFKIYKWKPDNAPKAKNIVIIWTCVDDVWWSKESSSSASMAQIFITKQKVRFEIKLTKKTQVVLTTSGSYLK